MIIKPLSRKNKSFSQAVYYLIKKGEDHNYRITHNFFGFDRGSLVEEFEENYKFCPKRKNGNTMYHDVISLEPGSKLPREEQKRILMIIAERFIQKRANDSLVLGALHDEEGKKLHMHILISGNKVESKKKTRLPIWKYNKIRCDLENWVLEKFPALAQKRIMGKMLDNPRKKERLSHKGDAMKQRTGKNPPQRQRVIDGLDQVFDTANTKEQFFELLHENEIEIYVRGSAVGVVDLKTGRKHRLKRIGRLEAFHRFSQQVELGELSEAKTRQRTKKASSKPYRANQKPKDSDFQQEAPKEGEISPRASRGRESNAVNTTIKENKWRDQRSNRKLVNVRKERKMNLGKRTHQKAIKSRER